MSHSLRAKIKGLRYKGIITDKDCDRLRKALDNEGVLDKIRAEIEYIAFDWQEIDGEHESFMVIDLNDALQIIDKYRGNVNEI